MMVAVTASLPDADAVHAPVGHLVEHEIHDMTRDEVVGDNGCHTAVRRRFRKRCGRLSFVRTGTVPGFSGEDRPENLGPPAAVVFDPCLHERPREGVVPAAELPDIVHPEGRNRPCDLGLKGRPEIDDLLHVQFHVPKELHPGVDRRNPAPAPRLAVPVPDAANGHQVRRAEDDAVKAHGHRPSRYRPRCGTRRFHEDDMVAEAVAHQLFMTDGDGILHVHPHLAFDDVGGGARSSPGPVEPDLDHHLIVLGDPGKARDDELDIGDGETLMQIVVLRLIIRTASIKALTSSME